MATVLVVDDEPGIRSVVGKVLEEAGHGVATASNGAEALDRLRRAQSDCVLLDLHMPVMDGESFLEALRAEPGYTKVPVVLFTSERDAVAVAAAMDVQACISKPFDLDAVAETVSRVMGASVTARREHRTANEVRRPALVAVLPAHVASLRQRAHWTRQTIARSQRTMARAEDCLSRITALAAHPGS